MRAVKVQVPGPVGVVVPPTTLELRKGEKGKQSTGKYTHVVWVHTVHPASFGLLPGEDLAQLVPVCADGGGK